jgi:carotenoid cleavage dioxygenase-like enzyme
MNLPAIDIRSGEPIATIRLPVRVPLTFHGGWAPDHDAAPPVS